MPEPRDSDIEVMLDGEPLSVLSHGRLNAGPDAGLTVVHCTRSAAAHDDPTADRFAAIAVSETIRASKVEARLAVAEALLRDLRRTHRYVEDPWYSCPKDEDGCIDDRQGGECNCGADEHNARIDAFLSAGDPDA